MSRNNKQSFWQSDIWSDILTRTGQAQVIQYTSGDVSLLIERRALWHKFTGLYILGPDSESIQPHILADIIRHSTQPSDLFLQIEPLTGDVKGGEKAPFRRFLEPTTAILPLKDMSEDDLMRRFEEKGRYNIRVAERRGLTAHWVQGASMTSLRLPCHVDTPHITNTELFFRLLEETTERDGFSHNSLTYYQEFIAQLEHNAAGGLLFVTKDETLHAAGVFVYTATEGIYYYGASSNAQEIRRDHGTYLLQWEAIREALRRGCSTYDFLGISSLPGDALAGVTTFKMRFHPEVVHLPDENVVILRPYILSMLRYIRIIRKWIKRARYFFR